jgi:hypothetical protein
MDQITEFEFALESMLEDAGDIAKLSVGVSHVCTLDSDGDIRCMGFAPLPMD